MYIELEGADAVGKTTLAQELMKIIPDCEYIHATYKCPGREFEYHSSLMLKALKLARSGRSVIMDRNWVSEMVYAGAYRGGTRWPLMGRYMERLFHKMCGTRIFCLHDGSIADYRRHFKKTREKREEMYDDTCEVAMIYKRLWKGGEPFVDASYPLCYASQIGRQGGFIREDNNYLYMIKDWGSRIREYYQKVLYQRRECLMFLDSNNCTGNFGTSRFLLVGDEVNHSRKNSPRWPFHNYYNSGIYITSWLQERGVNERSLCWTNINEKDGVEVVDAWMRTHSKNDVVIVMGNNALETFEENFTGRGSHFVMHPQCAARFPKNRVKFNEQMCRAFNI